MRGFLISLFLIVCAFEVSAQNQTLRVDYVFSGTDKSAEISLDEMSCFDGWAGRRVNLNDVPVRGNGQICMVACQTGDTLYRHSFSTLFQEWQTTEEATRVRKSFENVFLLPSTDGCRKRTLRDAQLLGHLLQCEAVLLYNC